MATPKTVTVNEKTFIIHPLSIWKANAANANLMAIFGPLVGGVFSKGGAAEIDISAVSQVLLSMDEDKQSRLIANLLSSCIYRPDDGMDLSLKPLNEPKNMELAFNGDVEGMYMLALEVMEANNFPFFKKVKAMFGAFGSAMTKTGTSEDPTQKEQ